MAAAVAAATAAAVAVVVVVAGGIYSSLVLSVGSEIGKSRFSQIVPSHPKLFCRACLYLHVSLFDKTFCCQITVEMCCGCMLPFGQRSWPRSTRWSCSPAAEHAPLTQPVELCRSEVSRRQSHWSCWQSTACGPLLHTQVRQEDWQVKTN